MEADPRLVGRVVAWARVLAVLVALVGAAVVVGWLVNDPRINRYLHGRFIMQLNTGVTFVVCGLGAWLATRTGRRRRLLQLACGTVAAAGGAFILLLYALDREPSQAATRMEVETAACFVLGLSTVFLILAMMARFVDMREVFGIR